VSAAVLLAEAAHQQLPGVFGTFEPVLRHYGYLAVGGVLFAENVGIPFPGETLLIAAALYAGTGQLQLWLVIVVAIVASIAGAAVGYLIGAQGGRPLVERYGRYVFLTPERVGKVEDFFTRHGGWVVVAARFVDGVRQLTAIVVGISDMTFVRFIGYSSVGAVLWCVVWALLGDLAGQHVETISTYSTYGFIALAVLALAWFVHHRRSRRRGTVPR
jgi:membrane protein DedA with SNARE-associated domain